MKSIITYLRILYHEFWMRYWVGPPSDSETMPELVPMLDLLTQPTQEGHEPLKVNCSAPVLNPELSRCINQWNNPIPTIDFGSMVKSENRIWVYNASRVEHRKEHPMLGAVKIPANTTKKKYCVYTSFPEVIMNPKLDIENNTITYFPSAGKFFVEDLICPDNGFASIGNDFSIRGVFWSYSNPPKKIEVDIAVNKMAKHYRDLLERAGSMYEASRVSPRVVAECLAKGDKLEDALVKAQAARMKLEITPEMHAAANYFKVITPWHQVLS